MKKHHIKNHSAKDKDRTISKDANHDDTVIVIGGAGYIGSHVVQKFCDEKFSVLVLDNLSTGYLSNIDRRARFIKGDILNPKDLNKAFALAEKYSKHVLGVVHLAAFKAVGESMSYPERYAQNNIIGTINILNAMSVHKVRNLVFSSTAAVYGTPKYIPLDESHPLNPESFYGFTKLEIERILEWYSRLGKINYAALRYFNAAGYGSIKGKEKNPANLLPIIMEVASGKRKSMDVYGNDFKTNDGTGVRDYIHVLDLADVHVLAMRHISEKKSNILMNVATGKGSSVLEIINLAKEITGKKINYNITKRRAGDPAVSIASERLAQELLGWKAKHSDMRNILKTMWDIYKE